jgi:hypothetical protein
MAMDWRQKSRDRTDYARTLQFSFSMILNLAMWGNDGTKRETQTEMSSPSFRWEVNPHPSDRDH